MKKKKQVNSDNNILSFSNLYIKFESLSNCQFSTIVTFPEEEDLQRRKRNAEMADLSLLGQRDFRGDNRSNEDMSERELEPVPGQVVNAK